MKGIFKIVYDSPVIDEPVIEVKEFAKVEDADEYAYLRSRNSEFSEGNYDIYVLAAGEWLDALPIEDNAVNDLCREHPVDHMTLCNVKAICGAVITGQGCRYCPLWQSSRNCCFMESKLDMPIYPAYWDSEYNKVKS